MAAKKNSQLVYTSTAGRTCPKCGWPVASCRCSTTVEEKVPDKIVVKMRIEKAGRGGKTVTVLDDLPRNKEFLKELAGELKRLCGSGGTVTEKGVEIQGDHREVVRARLQAKGWWVKGP